MQTERKSTAYTTRMKPGRNAICPCGSEQKFKKCCLQGWEWFALIFAILDNGHKVRGKDGTILFEEKDRAKLEAAALKIGMSRS